MSWVAVTVRRLTGAGFSEESALAWGEEGEGEEEQKGRNSVEERTVFHGGTPFVGGFLCYI